MPNANTHDITTPFHVIKRGNNLVHVRICDDYIIIHFIILFIIIYNNYK